MEDQKKSNNLVSNLWRNWCNLNPQQRSQVADRLGPVGHMLSIAANVSVFAQNGAEMLAGTESQQPRTESSSEPDYDEDDIIDAEFVEESDT